MPAYEPWQPDPTGRHEKRWRRKDGTWGNQVADAGVTSTDHYTGPQPDPNALTEQPALEPESEPVAQRIANIEPVRAAAREPLSFWGHAWATAFGIALSIPLLIAGAAVALVVLSEAIPD